ncbi:MAG: c-type cytochrome [Opitutaceae bacterium]
MNKTVFLGLASSLLLAGPATRLAADAAANWTRDCAACHGRDGAGHTRVGHMLGVKDLRDPAYQKTFTDDGAFAGVRNGLKKDGKTKMKPFAGKLSDAAIKELVAYVRTLAK